MSGITTERFLKEFLPGILIIIQFIGVIVTMTLFFAKQDTNNLLTNQKLDQMLDSQKTVNDQMLTMRGDVNGLLISDNGHEIRISQLERIASPLLVKSE